MGIGARPLNDRILERITLTEGGCWQWDTIPPSQHGYGQIWVGSRSDGTRKRLGAHVASYETFVGPVPDDHVVDHLCRNPGCVNPEHLEAVSRRDNLLRSPLALVGKQHAQSHCLRGHPFSADNTYINRGKRYCRTCRKVTK